MQRAGTVMEMKNTVSVAMCTFNGESYLQEQLASICRQTVLPDELVVCDDASTDATVRILTQFKETCGFPVRVFVNETNQGVCMNFARAISHCSGDLIVLADQDDIWQADKIEIMRHVFQQ